MIAFPFIGARRSSKENSYGHRKTHRDLGRRFIHLRNLSRFLALQVHRPPDAGAHFTTLREWSGIGLFFPAGPWVIGLGELLSSLLLIGIPVILLLTKKGDGLIGKSQFLGALVAFGIMSGAIVFHLFTPLGIETPVEWANGVPTEYSPALFYLRLRELGLRHSDHGVQKRRHSPLEIVALARGRSVKPAP